MIVAGIDVGGPGKGFHAISLEGVQIIDVFSSKKASEIAEWLVKTEVEIVAIDAPSRWSIDGHARQAERSLMKKKIWCFSTPVREVAVAHKKQQFSWMLEGESLYQNVATHYEIFEGKREPRSRYCIETFPHAVVCSLKKSVVSAKRKGYVRREVLRAEGLVTSKLRNIDFVDAALCAVAARRFARGEYESYGCRADGYIVIPTGLNQSASELETSLLGQHGKKTRRV